MADNASNLATVSIPMWALIVSLIVGTIAGTWALSAEVHNYRLENITTRLGTHESSIMSNKIQIEHNTTVVERMIEDIGEIKADLKTLIGKQ